MFRPTAAYIGVFVALGLAGPAGADFLQAEPPPFVGWDGLFSLRMPHGWGQAESDDAAMIVLKPVDGSDAFVVIRRVQVPAGAHPRQLVLNAIDQRLSKMPRFELLKKRDAKVSGAPAAVVIGRYAHQGNIQYPRIVEELHVVVNTRGFIVHFDSFEVDAPVLAPALEVIYRTFVSPAGATIPGQEPPAAPLQDGAWLQSPDLWAY